MASDHDAFSYVSVLADADLAPEDDVVLDSDAARESRLRGDDDVLADLAVVADVDEVVYLRPATDARGFERAAVDSCIGADFDIILDNELADLREFFVAPLCRITDIAEAVAAEDRARMDDHSVADTRPRINGYSRVDFAVFFNADVSADYAARTDPGSIANGRVFANECPWINNDGLGDLCRRQHDRARVRSFLTPEIR